MNFRISHDGADANSQEQRHSRGELRPAREQPGRQVASGQVGALRKNGKHDAEGQDAADGLGSSSLWMFAGCRNAQCPSRM